MKLQATTTATRRTKNRIIEHTEHTLAFVKTASNHATLKKQCTLFLCECGWFGWLPNDEWQDLEQV